jgi:hypothetical protein
MQVLRKEIPWIWPGAAAVTATGSLRDSDSLASDVTKEHLEIQQTKV